LDRRVSALRVLVTGAGGQLGHDVAAAFEGHDVTALDRDRLDVADREAVLQACGGFRPDVIVHAAAWTDVDACEGDPVEAQRVNGFGTRNVVEGARLVAARVCYVSTDYVFDGTSAVPYTEWDEPRPLSAYGRSKLAGERELDPGSLVVRTSWLSGGGGGRNIVKTVLRLDAERDELTFVDDQRGCPSFTSDVATMIRRLVVERRTGTFHVTNQGVATWYQFARDVLIAAGRNPQKVRPVSTAELHPPRPAPRPANSVLDNAALRFEGIPLLPDYHEPLERMVKELTA
jgi:dTDP-4-dehydrorhamnose reductase